MGEKSAKARPVGNVSFALNYYFHQYELGGYHVVNIIIHILSGIVLYAFLRITLSLPAAKLNENQAYIISFFAALLWLVHPLQTQSVTYIVQRLNSLAALFYLLSLWFYLRGRLAQEKQKKWPWFACGGLAWMLALGCKQNAATLPFFVFLYEWYFFQDCSADWLKRNLKYLILLVFLFALVALMYIGLKPAEKMASIGDYSLKEFTFLQRVLTQPRVVIYYLSLIFFPQPGRLNLDYDFPLSDSLINPVTTLLSIVGIISLLVLAFYLAKRERLISFCILWFLGNLVIESSIIPLAVIFEHRNYLPSMMVCLIPVLLAFRYVNINWLRIGLLCGIVLVLAIWTYQRNRVWESHLTLWTDVVKKSPNKERPHSSLALALANIGDLDKAIEHYKKALQVSSKYPQTRNNLGAALAKQGKFDEAIEQYREALQLNPAYVEVLSNLGLALKNQGKNQEAIAQYQKALAIDPGFVKAYKNMGDALVDLDKTDEAIAQYRTALRIDPHFVEAYINLGIALKNQGKINEAAAQYQKALQIKPDFEQALNNLGVLLIDRGKTDEAIAIYRKALQASPDFAKVHRNLGYALAKQGNVKEALEHYKKALQLDPQDAETLFNLGSELARRGKTEQAIHHLNKAVQIKPDYAEAHSNLGGMYIQQGNIAKAIYHSEEALRLDPQLVEAYNSLGIGLMNEGKIDAAISQFQKAIQLKPDFTMAANNLNRALAIRNELEAEISRRKKMLKDNPDNLELQFQLGNLYFRIGELRQAKQHYEKALQLNPNFVPALNNLALVSAADKAYDSALKSFLEVLNYYPDDTETHYNVARMYSRLNKLDESIAWLKKAIDKGYADWESIKTDEDLDNVRGSEAFQELIKGQ